MNYREAVDGNETFFTSRPPGAAAGRPARPAGTSSSSPTGWSPGWPASAGSRRSTPAAMPNFPANLLDNYNGRSFDPDTNLAAPWQSGHDGHRVSTRRSPAPLDLARGRSGTRSTQGKITYLDRDARHGRARARSSSGSTRQRSPRRSSSRSLAEVDDAVEAGIPRQLAGNYYVDIMLARRRRPSAWPGRATSSASSSPTRPPSQDFQWALPTEGGMLWTDNMVIPKGRREQGPGGALDRLLLRARERRDDRGLGELRVPGQGRARGDARPTTPTSPNNPLIFPTEEMTARLHQFRATSEDEETRWAEDFSRVLGL